MTAMRLVGKDRGGSLGALKEIIVSDSEEVALHEKRQARVNGFRATMRLTTVGADGAYAVVYVVTIRNRGTA